MDLGARTPLLDVFRKGDAPRDVRLVAAEGGLADRPIDQIDILLLLLADSDAEVASTAQRTLDGLDASAVGQFLAQPATSDDARTYFAQRGIAPAAAVAANGHGTGPVAGGPAPTGAAPNEGAAPDGEREASTLQRIASLTVAQRIAVAMKGTREERGILIRDPNRIVTAAVLSSPKMTETEIASIAKMANVSDDVLRTIAMNRAWLKNYSVALALVKNPKTPVAMSLNLMNRLSARDLRMVSTDRNVPDALRVSARKKIVIDK